MRREVGPRQCNTKYLLSERKGMRPVLKGVEEAQRNMSPYQEPEEGVLAQAVTIVQDRHHDTDNGNRLDTVL